MTTIILNVLILAVCIYILAIVTDEFFIVSLDRISHRLKLPSDVAGASLMAMGSSAPELAIALLALFQGGGEHSDVGIGTIVGSAVFNILMITGISAIARPARITWNVVVRDVVVYVASIALLLATFRDSTITLLEAVAFIALYGIYLLILANWRVIDGDADPGVIDLVDAEIDVERGRPGIYFRVTGLVSRAIGVLMGDPHRNYVRSFAVSIGFIVVISWFLVQAAINLAEGIGIPPVIVALTVLAGGTSVPDLFASVVVARQGRGDMAVANAVGSNVFDILVGLGLPWIIVILIEGGVVQVGTADLWGSTLVLLGTVVLLFVFLTTQRLLSRLEGWLLVAAYAVFVVWTWLGG